MNNYSDKLKDPRWQRKRCEILMRDNFTCQNCKDETSHLHVHHLKYSGEPWEVEEKHLITLCDTCHADAHRSQKDKEAEKELIRVLRERGLKADAIMSIAKTFTSFCDEIYSRANEKSLEEVFEKDPWR